MGGISVTNPDRGIAWNFRLYNVDPSLPVLPLRGLFWFHDEETDGFVAVQNASEEFISVTPRFHIAGTFYPLAPVSLASGQGFKLELRRELRPLGLADVNAGGIEFLYEGPPDALKAHGVLFNGRGFSAEVDFSPFAEWPDRHAVTLRTPRFAVGRADPALGLPARTRFDAYLALHNFNQHDLAVTVTAGYQEAGSTQEHQIPVSLAPGDTQVLSLHPYLRDVVPEDAHWASLEVSYSDRHNGLVAALVSVSRDGEHSIRSVLNWVRGSKAEGWLWRADVDYNTFITMLNTDTEEARVVVSLDYHVNGVRYSYDLAERAIPARASDAIDVGQVIASAVPDADGDVIPSSVSFGGYSVRKTSPSQCPTLTTEALLFNRRQRTFLSFYNTCCGDYVYVDPFQFLDPVGFNGRLIVWSCNFCSGICVEIVQGITYWSTNPAIASVDGGGNVAGIGPGNAVIWAHFEYPAPPRRCPIEACECEMRTRDDDTPATPFELSVSLSPTSVLPQGSTTVTVSTNPAVSGVSISLSAVEQGNSGGHIHLGRPLGSFSSSSGTTDSNGQFVSNYTASLFGGTEIINARANTANGVADASAALTVAVLSLFQLGPGANYNLVGATPTHPSNHFGTLVANSGLANIANQYAAQFPGSILLYNDQSLIRGGLFDIAATWSTPHIEHRLGGNCDVSDSSVPSDRWAALESIFIANNASFLREPGHWHLRF